MHSGCLHCNRPVTDAAPAFTEAALNAPDRSPRLHSGCLSVTDQSRMLRLRSPRLHSTRPSGSPRLHSGCRFVTDQSRMCACVHRTRPSGSPRLRSGCRFVTDQSRMLHLRSLRLRSTRRTESCDMHCRLPALIRCCACVQRLHSTRPSADCTQTAMPADQSEPAPAVREPL